MKNIRQRCRTAGGGVSICCVVRELLVAACIALVLCFLVLQVGLTFLDVDLCAAMGGSVNATDTDTLFFPVGEHNDQAATPETSPATVDGRERVVEIRSADTKGYLAALMVLKKRMDDNGLDFASSYPYLVGVCQNGLTLSGAPSFLQQETVRSNQEDCVGKRVFDSIDWLDNFKYDGVIKLDPTDDALAIQWLGGDLETGVVNARVGF